MHAVALVLGAGRGVRLESSVPKAHVSIAGQTLLAWSAHALGRARGVTAVLPVIAPGAETFVDALRAEWAGTAELLAPVEGGRARQDSVAAGLRALPEDTTWVLVHDAARALVLPGDAEEVLSAAQETGAALPVLPLSDTIKELDGNRVVSTADRSRLARALTPQAFRVSLLSEAIDKAVREGFVGTDCSSLVERLGVEVRICSGRTENFKVTTPEDLERARVVLESRETRP